MRPPRSTLGSSRSTSSSSSALYLLAVLSLVHCSPSSSSGSRIPGPPSTSSALRSPSPPSSSSPTSSCRRAFLCVNQAVCGGRCLFMTNFKSGAQDCFCLQHLSDHQHTFLALQFVTLLEVSLCSIFESLLGTQPRLNLGCNDCPWSECSRRQAQHRCRRCRACRSPSCVSSA